ncbi:MAG: ABC transporter ATP-binding protein [Candidatus Bathyarchaeia archaeon]
MREVEINNLTFVYENRKDPALEQINLTVDSQEFVLLAGASGSGKSTLLKCINGLIPHRYVGDYSGEVKVRGQPISSSRFLDLSLVVGTVLQESDKQFVSSIVEDDVAFGPGNLALPRREIEQRVTHGLQSVGILHLRERSLFALSGGEKQKLAIADILAMEPNILLFDEPLANLDSNGVRLMQGLFEELQASGKTIIVAEHRTEEVLRADPSRILVIDRGRVVADSDDPAILTNFADTLKVPAEYFVRLPQMITTSIQLQRTRPSVASQELGEELVRLQDVSFEYPGGIKALNNVSLTIREGERIALLGNNGAGKSTLAMSLVGILKPTSGQILVRGKETKTLSISEIARTICLVFQSPFSMIFAKTVRAELKFGPENIGLEPDEISKILPETARHCSIMHLLDNSPFASSFGEKKRICVASVLTMQPKCVILDEPTAGQDHRSYTSFMDFIASLRDRIASYIVITHDPDLAIEYTDRAIVLSNGRIIADGPTRTVLANPAILSQGAIRETSLIELSRKATDGKAVLTLAELLQASHISR